MDPFLLIIGIVIGIILIAVILSIVPRLKKTVEPVFPVDIWEPVVPEEEKKKILKYEQKRQQINKLSRDLEHKRMKEGKWEDTQTTDLEDINKTTKHIDTMLSNLPKPSFKKKKSNKKKKGSANGRVQR